MKSTLQILDLLSKISLVNIVMWHNVLVPLQAKFGTLQIAKVISGFP
ncbi:MAG: hypothetical protein O2829_06225 [Bacteroidetes bacterium]|nr:hypothetical protein [Bacteroidota bacterium]MDA1268672.1 hypothetical protein [Bacteroidota bacterium]